MTIVGIAKTWHAAQKAQHLSCFFLYAYTFALGIVLLLSDAMLMIVVDVNLQQCVVD